MANRVGEVLDQPTVDEWRPVKGTMNPADIGSRGVIVSQLLESERLNGQAWLTQNPSSCPKQMKIVDDDDTALFTNPTESVIDWSMLIKYKKMIKVIVYCLTFRSKQRDVVTALDRQTAELLLWHMMPRESLAELFSNFADNSGDKVNHDLPKLSPIVDSEKTIRLTGRLSKTTINDVLKNSILLLAMHPAVVPMLRQMHEDNHHDGSV